MVLHHKLINRIRQTNRRWTVAALMLGLFMGALEMTVVSTAMPTVIGDLGGIELYSWVITAYMLAATVTVPLFGKLADVYGRKPVMMFGLGVFLVGSMASGQAHSMPQLIAFRGLQGLGAGAMQPIALTIIGDIFNIEERSKMQGLFGAVWGLAGIVGPMLGGVIVQYLSWRWVFYVNVPFGAASMLILQLALHESIEKKPHSLDVAGAGLLMAASVGFLAGSHGGLTALVAIPIAVALLIAFVLVERRVAEPALPLTMLAQRMIGVSSVCGAFVGATMMSVVSYVPLFVQGVLGGSPTEAGATITPMVIAWPLASALGGRILPRLGFRPLIHSGMAMVAAASVALALLLQPEMNLNWSRACVGLMGLGLGFANTALLIAVQTSVEWQQRGVATASTMFFRTMGGMFAVGVMGGILASALARDPSIPVEAANELLGPEHGRTLSPEVLRRLAGALQGGLGTVFWIIAALGIASFLSSLALPKMDVRQSE